ncbi:hypothetical protein [Patulibacter sp.]|uniref:hypothetical protein n=1 Tax=Patulibacter sp. TaxID=1912859 RepID=UPI00271DCB78|nr:hypothetical protein [Patulibacter sp.]MDO9410635.1 hypothetical protein [Patulibacter sp.]
MRVPSRAVVVLPCVLVPLLLAGCGGSGDPPDRASVPDPRLRGLEARSVRAPAVLRAAERIAGEDTVVDLTFERDRFTVLTAWVTREERENPANQLQEGSAVRDSGKIASICRAVRGIDPGADAYVTGYDGVSWREGCPQNGDVDGRR